jgi:hypothetical protein
MMGSDLSQLCSITFRFIRRMKSLSLDVADFVEKGPQLAKLLGM